MNSLDKLITWFSPATGLRRARARAAASVYLSYEAVRSGRRQGGWNTSGTSGNAEIASGLEKIRSNARDLQRNNSYARKAVREWSKRVVGTGIWPRPTTGNPRTDGIIRQRFQDWAKTCVSDKRLHWGGALKLIVSSTFVSGETLVRLWDRRLGDGLPVPFQFQVLESDYLDMAKTVTLAGGYIIQGVQFDKLGRIQGYWLFGQHPGDVINTSNRGLISQFIPAEGVLHHLETERPQDVRAVSRFAAGMSKLRDLDELSDAMLMRKKIEACLTGMFTQPEGEEGPTAGPVVTDSEGNRVESFQPGMMLYGKPGTSAQFFAPTANADYPGYKKAELREFAVGVEIPYVLLDDNLEAVNYSSFRGGLLAYRDGIIEYRENWLIPQICDPIYERFIAALVMMGEIPEAQSSYAHEWDSPQFDLLDRGAEAEADRLELQLGKKTWPELVGEQGSDPEQQVTVITEWRKRLEEAGVTFARNVTDNTGSANNANGQNQPAAP